MLVGWLLLTLPRRFYPGLNPLSVLLSYLLLAGSAGVPKDALSLLTMLERPCLPPGHSTHSRTRNAWVTSPNCRVKMGSSSMNVKLLYLFGCRVYVHEQT